MQQDAKMTREAAENPRLTQQQRPASEGSEEAVLKEIRRVIPKVMEELRLEEENRIAKLPRYQRWRIKVSRSLWP